MPATPFSDADWGVWESPGPPGREPNYWTVVDISTRFMWVVYGRNPKDWKQSDIRRWSNRDLDWKKERGLKQIERHDPPKRDPFVGKWINKDTGMGVEVVGYYANEPAALRVKKVTGTERMTKVRFNNFVQKYGLVKVR